MSLPKPTPGLDLRYGYLWADDAQAGADTGKDRPAAIVLTVSEDAETWLNCHPRAKKLIPAPFSLRYLACVPLR